MGQAGTIELGIAKRVSQAHEPDVFGYVAFRKRLVREKLLGFSAARSPCMVAVEACAGVHRWGRA